jgi:adenylate kinase family enzyme
MNAMDNRQMQRVVVIGSSCSGKTTFARQLAQALGRTPIELDAIYWKPNWCPRPLEEFRAQVEKAITVRRILLREELFSGNRETWRVAFLQRDSLIWWVITTYRRQREYRAFFIQRQETHLACIEFRTQSQADEFLRAERQGSIMTEKCRAEKFLRLLVSPR